MLSVLIVNWNTRDLLRACLASLQRYPPSIPMEVIVVDNASHDGSADMVRSEFPAVKILASEVNTGYAAGNNLAFRVATGEWLLTLNPDTELVDDSLDKALTFMRDHPKAGWLGIRQVGSDGSTQASIRGFPTARGIFGMMTGLGRKLPGTSLDSYRLHGFDYGQAQRAPQPMGTFLLLRRQALQDPSQPFDERFPIFFNEVDLLYRMHLQGWEGWYTPEAQILHHGGESTKQVRKSMIWESHRSLVRYLWKHYGTGLSAVGLPFVSAIVYLAAFVRARGYDAGFRPRA